MLTGDEASVLFDCGMMFCADETINNVKAGLQGRPLDYIFATHTHYDHIGALPFFRREWPEVKLATTSLGAAVLQKETPRRVIRELSYDAAVLFAPGRAESCMDYNDETLFADVILKENDEIPLGGLTVKVIETPGHTRDALSFFIPELKLLILSESTGGVVDGQAYCSYLTSYDMAIESIRKCSLLPYEYISQAHTGIIQPNDMDGFFHRTEAAARECKDFILFLRDSGMNSDEILKAFSEKYMGKTILDIQPEASFVINAKATIGCTLRDF